jgi:hypothetical protein
MGCYAVAAMLEEPPSVASRHPVESSAGASEMAEVKREIRRVITEVDSGHTKRGVGAVLFQGFNTLLKATEVERKIREQEELETRLTLLERQYEQRRRDGYRQDSTGGASW